MSNNNIIDGSGIGARAITVNGDVQQGAFSPYAAGGYSYEFGGSSSLTIPDATQLGAGDFSIEFWMKTSQTSASLLNPETETGAGKWGVFVDEGDLTFQDSYMSGASAWTVDVSSILDSTWHHVAISRSSGTFAVYLDGISQSSKTGTFLNNTTNHSVTTGLKIGDGFKPDFVGLLNDLRIAVGTAVYTDDFTPPTEPLTLTDETVLLTCNKPYISALSTVDVQVQDGTTNVVQKFVTGTKSSNSYRGAVYIDNLSGTGQVKITASDGGASDQFGCSISSDSKYLAVGAKGDNSNTGSVYIYDQNDSDIAGSEVKITASDGDAADYFGSAVAIANNKVAVSARGDNSNTGSAYIYDINSNGTVDLTSEVKITASDGAADDSFGTAVAINDNKVVVGSYADDDGGSATGSVYVYDLDGTNEVKITASDGAAFDRFGDIVLIADNKLFIGVGRHNNYAGAIYIYDLTASDIPGSEVKIAGNDYFGSSVAVANDKMVVGAIRDMSWRGAAYIYDINSNGTVDLTSEVKITASDAAANDYFGHFVAILDNKVVVGAPNREVIGGNDQNVGSVYIYDFDGTNEIQIQASDWAEHLNFGANLAALPETVPAYQTQTSTSRLSPTLSGDVSTERSAPYSYLDYSAASHGGSAVFDGTGDYLSISSSDDFDLGTADFTVEMWVNASSFASEIALIDARSSDTNSNYGMFINTSGQPYFRSASGSKVSTVATNINVWTHVAFSRSSDYLSIYVNGVLGYNGALSDSLTQSGYNIGIDCVSTKAITGKLSDVRVVKEAAVYTADFTPPTAPLTAVTGTTLLLPFDDATIFDRTGSGIFELKGTPTISTADSPYGATYKSLEFDGLTDYIEVDNDLLEFDGNFTAEAWIKPTSTAGQVIELADGSGVKISQVSNTSSVDTAAIELWVSGANPNYNLKTIPAGTTVQYDANSYLYTDYNNGGGDYTRSGILEIGSWAANETSAVVIDFNNSFLHMDNINGSNTSFHGGAFQVFRGGMDVTLKNLNLKISGTSTYWFAIGYEGYGDPNKTITFENCTIDLSDWTSENDSRNLYLNGQSVVLDSNTTVIKNASAGDVFSALINYGTFTNNGNIYTHTSNEGSALLPLIDNIMPPGEFYDVVFHYGSSDQITSSSSYSTTQSWKHVAVSRRDSAIKLFVDGTSVGSASSSATIGSEGTAVVGAGATGADKFTGLISDIRISSSNVYYSDFTAPSAPLTLDTTEEYVPYVAPVYNDYAAEYVALTGKNIVTVANAGTTVNLDTIIDGMQEGDALLLDAGEYVITTTPTADNSGYGNDILRGKNIAVVGKTLDANDVVLTFAGLSKRDTHIFPIDSNLKRHYANIKIVKPSASLNYSAALVGGVTSSSPNNPTKGSCRNVIIDFSGGVAAWKYNSAAQTDVLWNHVSFVNYWPWYTSYGSNASGQTITNCSFARNIQVDSGTFVGTNPDTVTFGPDNSYANSSTSGHLYEADETGTIRVS